MAINNVLENIKLNQTCTKSKLHSQVLLWDRTVPAYDELGVFDVIIAADCLFLDQYHEDLLHVLSILTKQDGIVIIFAPKRGHTQASFKEKASKTFCD